MKYSDPSYTISASRLSRGFVNGQVKQDVVRDVSLEIRRGELTIIIGPSGSGKSTLLALLSGLLVPERGSVNALGTELEKLDSRDLDRFRLSHSGFVFQGFNLFESLTALEQVAVPLKYAGKASRDARSIATKALGDVGLTGKEHLRPAQLSGGEKQRVAIARAIAKEPKLLFADEPTSALDSANAERIIELFQQIAHKRLSTVVCVTHDDRLLRYADRVLHLRDGVILENT